MREIFFSCLMRVTHFFFKVSQSDSFFTFHMCWEEFFCEISLPSPQKSNSSALLVVIWPWSFLYRCNDHSYIGVIWPWSFLYNTNRWLVIKNEICSCAFGTGMYTTNCPPTSPSWDIGFALHPSVCQSVCLSVTILILQYLGRFQGFCDHIVPE